MSMGIYIYICNCRGRYIRQTSEQKRYKPERMQERDPREPTEGYSGQRTGGDRFVSLRRSGGGRLDAEIPIASDHEKGGEDRV